MRPHGRASLRASSLSLYRRVEVFSARSSLNYSWKCQIRRPFSVRAYGNGDKSDLRRCFPFYRKRAFARFLFPFSFSHFSSFVSLFFSIILFALSHLVFNIRLSLFKTQRSSYLLFLFALCVTFRDYLYLVSPCVAFLQICGAVLLRKSSFLLIFLLFLLFHSTIFII